MEPKAAITELLDTLSQEQQERLLAIVRGWLEQAPQPTEDLPWKAGVLKGKIWMAPDFDEPLEDFKEYME